MEVTFARAKDEDAEELVAIQIAAFHSDAVLYPGVPEDGPPGYKSVDAMRERIERDDTYTIRADGRLVGGIVVFDRGEGAMHLDVLFVDPALHGQGIGSQAMAFLDRRYPDAALWTLDTPAYATRNHHFYEKCGYVRAREFEVDGFRLYAYERALRPDGRTPDSTAG